MSDSDSEYSSDRDSLESIAPYETRGLQDDPQELQRIASVRDAVRTWKQRELDKNSNKNQKPKGLGSLRKYVANSAKLYYDLNTYLNTSQNDEKNMTDDLYRSIVAAIGVPGTLPFHTKFVLESLLERDLIELPFTIEPKVVNTYAKQGIHTNTDFPDEE